MSMVSTLKTILAKQKESMSALEKEISQIEKSDLVTENQSLKNELLKYKSDLKNEEIENKKLSDENKNLKNALYEQLYNEKTYILNSVSKRMDVYYKSNITGEINRLEQLENSVKNRIDQITHILKTNRVDIQDEIYGKIAELRKLLNEKVTMARMEIESQTVAFNKNRAEELSKLKQEQLTEEEIKSRIKQNNIESLIGLSIINKLGIFLLIIGVIAASQFTYYKLSDSLKCVFMFSIGLVLLLAGEWLNRRKPNIFSLGLTSGGIAILYVALALSYFRFDVLSMYPALALCVLITLGAFILSQRYNAQNIAAFAMIGGYLPIFSIAGDKTIVYGAMVYFVILNILALLQSFNKKWLISAFIGYVLNVIGSIYISSIMFYKTPFFIDGLITILYLIFAFVTYTLIPVLGSFKKQVGFKTSDTILLALNTLISSIILYFAFYAYDLENFTGLLALTFSVIYLLLGRFIEKYMPKEKTIKSLFYITTITFVVLIIPFQFDVMWLSLGWLVEGIAILIYGIFKEIKGFKKAGVVISSLCLSSFLFFDVLIYPDHLFTYKYLAITLSSIIALASLIYKKNLANKPIKLFKYASVINIWVFSIYILQVEFRKILLMSLSESSFDINYMITATIVISGFLIAYIIPRISAIRDNMVKGISIAIYVTSIVILFILNFNSPVIGSLNEVPTLVSVIGTIQLAMIALLSILALRDLVLCLVLDKKLGIQWYPFIVSFYFVVILTQNLITQYNLVFNNAVISIIYLTTALIWITFGFIKRYAFMRRFGLGLSILAAIKLFIIDLSFLTQGYKIVSYFVFGITLLAISFVYQYFSKRIDTINQIIPDNNKNFQ
ncbi:UNVERIFIED_CONTAM: putative membrane protein DUF2339 [Acetivibrio alkalicellulosi]